MWGVVPLQTWSDAVADLVIEEFLKRAADHEGVTISAEDMQHAKRLLEYGKCCPRLVEHGLYALCTSSPHTFTWTAGMFKAR